MSFTCRWLQQHLHALGPLADRTVQQLGLADHWVLKTPLDTSCIQVCSLRCSALSVSVLMAELCKRLTTGCQCVAGQGPHLSQECLCVHHLPSSRALGVHRLVG